MSTNIVSITPFFLQFALDISVFLKKAMDIVTTAQCRPLGFITDNAGNICNAVEMQPNTVQLNCLAHSAELLVKDLNALWPGLQASDILILSFPSVSRNICQGRVSGALLPQQHVSKMCLQGRKREPEIITSQGCSC